MRCELSELIKCLFLFSFLFFFFSLSFPIIHIFGERIFPETSVTIKLKPSSNFLMDSFSFLSNKKSKYIFYEKGKKVIFSCDGSIKTMFTRAKTVKDFLQNEKVLLGDFDTISFPLNKTLLENDHLVIKRIKYSFYDLNESIPFETIYENNPLVANGIKVVWEPGESGILSYKIRETHEDGILKQKKILSKKIIKKPIKEVIAFGTGEFNGYYKAKYRMYASSYNPTIEQCGPDPFLTASGLRVRFGVVAVDPKVIRLGTHLWVSGYGYAIAADTGGLIKGMRIDLFFWRRLPNENWKGWAIDVYLLD